jgi:hypothetical protein
VDALKVLGRVEGADSLFRDTWATHPDERVPMAVLRRFGHFPSACDEEGRKRIDGEARAEAEQHGILWNPLLDLYLSQSRSSSQVALGAQARLAGGRKWLQAQKDWKVLAPLLRFRSSIFLAEFARHAGVLSDDFVREAGHPDDVSMAMARNPNLAPDQAEHLFRTWATRAWPGPSAFELAEHTPGWISSDPRYSETPIHIYQSLLQSGHSAPAEIRDRMWAHIEAEQTLPAADRIRRDAKGRKSAAYRNAMALRATAYDPATPAERITALSLREKDELRTFHNALFHHPNATPEVRQRIAMTFPLPLTAEAVVRDPRIPPDPAFFKVLLEHQMIALGAELLERLSDAQISMIVAEMKPFQTPIATRAVQLLGAMPRLARGLTQEDVARFLVHPNGELRLAVIAALGARGSVTAPAEVSPARVETGTPPQQRSLRP